MEREAVLNRTYASASYAFGCSDELTELSRSIFGVAQEDVSPPDSEDGAAEDAFYEAYGLAYAPDWEQVHGFEALGWDVTDEYGHPLLVLRQFSYQLLAAIKGEFGAKLPGEVPVPADAWGAQLERDRAKFQRRQR
jgi:hypothetical protein